MCGSTWMSINPMCKRDCDNVYCQLTKNFYNFLNQPKTGMWVDPGRPNCIFLTVLIFCFPIFFDKWVDLGRLGVDSSRFTIGQNAYEKYFGHAIQKSGL